MTAALYKVLGSHGQPIHGGDGEWHLPKGRRPGKWMPKIGDVRCCARGYHLVERWALAEWLRADCTIYVAEGRGVTDSDGTGKTAYSQARLLRQVHISEQDLRLFAADCAEHVLPIFLKVCPDDDRPAKAIQAARQFARGEIDNAAGDAARLAAWAAERQWQAAEAAACSAAWAAARAAARAVAGDAAGDAAWAAGIAAGGDAARLAAWAAERQWQAARLATYLTEQP